MRKPTPEEFSLRTDQVKSLIEEKARRDKRREALCVCPCVSVCVVTGISFYLSKLSRFPDLVIEIIGLLVALAWIVGMCFGAGLIIGYPLLRLLNFILPDPQKYKTLDRYLQAVAQYDAWFIRTQEAFWNGLSGRAFEVEVTNLLNRAGYKATLTPGSGDGGVDIVLGDGTIVQCKAHRTSVSPGVVRELYGTLMHQKAPRAILISLNGVTNGAHSFISGKPITIWDRSRLISLQKSIAE